MATLPKFAPLSAPLREVPFSSIIRRIEDTNSEIVVRRRGKAIAKIIPFTECEIPSGYGWMRGTVQELGDIVGPTGEEWDVRDE
jgi:alpha-D-ribose 1-methylphosphonate 5-phosphate C-P lyase